MKYQILFILVLIPTVFYFKPCNAQLFVSTDIGLSDLHINLAVEQQWLNNSISISGHIPYFPVNEKETYYNSKGLGVGLTYKRFLKQKGKYNLFLATSYRYEQGERILERHLHDDFINISMSQDQFRHTFSEQLGVRWFSGKRLGFDFYYGPSFALGKVRENVTGKNFNHLYDYYFNKFNLDAISQLYKSQLESDFLNIDLAEYQQSLDEANTNYKKRLSLTRLGIRVFIRIR